MTLKELEGIRDAVKAQLESHERTPAAPGQDGMKAYNAIELRAALRTVEQIVTQEKASQCKLPGSLGPVLVGV